MTSDLQACQLYHAPAESLLLKNLAALWATEPRLAEAVELLEDSDAYEVESSRSGVPTASVSTAAGRRIFIHSRHRPVEEADRLLDGLAVTESSLFHVFGLGLGYHLQRLFARASEEALFCIYEPDLRMIRTALAQRDLSEALLSNRILWFTDPEKADIFRKLTPHTAMSSVGNQIVRHAASMQLHPGFFQQVEQMLGEFEAFCRTSMNTLLINAQKTAENIARNIVWYAASPSLDRLRDRRRAKPAIIVSAGPSLRKNQHLLRDLKDRAVIVAVQTTLKPLLEMGVEPDFVTSLDYHEICSRFFENLPGKIRTELIAEPKATHSIFELMTGPTTVCGNDYAESLLRELKLGKSALTSGATVAHLAFYVAEHLGCDPIIFIGQDLGFSDGLCYTPGTSYEDVWRPELSRFCTVEMKQWEQIVRERPILKQIPDFKGRPMYTEERLATYLHQFERDFARSKSRIIDATEGGALKRGTVVMPLAEAARRFCTALIEREDAPPPPMRWNLIDRCRQCILQRKEEAEAIAEISRQTLPLLGEIREHLSDQPRVNALIARVDRLRAQMDEHGRTYELVSQFTQQTELQRFKSDRRLAAERLEGADRQRRQVERDIENVEAVLSAAGMFIRCMDEVADALGESDERQREAA